jgi:hypothetical protein
VSDNIAAAVLLDVVFVASLFGLILFLAWLEQPAAERWRPSWWPRRARIEPGVSTRAPVARSAGGSSPAIGTSRPRS